MLYELMSEPSCFKKTVNARVSVVMLGARMHYAIPRLLHQIGVLDRFYTDSYVGNKPKMHVSLKVVSKYLKNRSLKQWLERHDSIIPSEKIVSFDYLGIWYFWALYRARNYSQRQIVFEKMAKRFSQGIISSGFGSTNVLWGFNGASLELFTAAKNQGITCVLEQTILPKRLELKLLREEVERWPCWESKLDLPETDSLLCERESSEWNMADYIIAGSEFVRDGLIECGVSAKKIRVVPYGVDTSRFKKNVNNSELDTGNPLRVLFAGHVSLRKGVPDLLQALMQFKPSEVETILAGTITLDSIKLERYVDKVKLLGRVSRGEMSSLLDWADVLVLPSIVEGSATVTYEALISGIPVITTPNAGSIVEDGLNGVIVPIRSPDVLAEAIKQYHVNRTMLAEHQARAVKSSLKAGLDRYREDLENLICEIVRCR